MKKSFFYRLFCCLFWLLGNAHQKHSNKDESFEFSEWGEYNTAMETKGYHFGDKIDFPKDVTENAESISISFGDKETSDLVIDPKFFTLGDNAM